MAFERVLTLAPGMIRRYPRYRDFDSLRLFGLEFAQLYGTERERIRFGVGPGQTELCEQNFDALEALVAERTGKDAALFVASGTMGNISSLLAHGQRGQEVILGDESHIPLRGGRGVGAGRPRVPP